MIYTVRESKNLEENEILVTNGRDLDPVIFTGKYRQRVCVLFSKGENTTKSGPFHALF